MARRVRSVLALVLALTAGSVGGCGNSTPSGVEPSIPGGTAARQPPAPHEGMVLVPAGSFLSGATEEQFRAYVSQSTLNFPGMAEALRKQFVIPYRPVDLPRFYIQEFETTNREFKDFIEATGYRPQLRQGYLTHWERGSYPDWAGEFPVVWVSATDAESYCYWRGGYLPSEDEWEKASRGASGRAFPWGNEFPTPETANFGRPRPEPVGNRAGDVSPYQAYDLGGNVSEWTSSRTQIEGLEYRVIRGGSFAQTARETLTARRRLEAAGTSEARFADVGFRCASK